MNLSIALQQEWQATTQPVFKSFSIQEQAVAHQMRFTQLYSEGSDPDGARFK